MAILSGWKSLALQGDREKKTVFWLSVWEDCVKISFYFTEKSGSGIRDLNLSPDIKERYEAGPFIGKLRPLIINYQNPAQLKDILTIVEYKKTAK